MENSRPIRFRAWDTIRKIMGTVGAINWNPDMTIKNIDFYYPVLVNEQDDVLCSITPMSDITIMQFTGLHDKNGKEIYESDVVSYFGYEVIHGKQERPERRRVIGKKDPIRNSYIDDCFHLQNLIEQGTQIEVIGNIYENGDLLK